MLSSEKVLRTRDKKLVQFYLHPDLHAWLVNEAKSARRSVNMQMCIFFEGWHNQMTQKRAAKAARKAAVTEDGAHAE